MAVLDELGVAGGRGHGGRLLRTTSKAPARSDARLPRRPRRADGGRGRHPHPARARAHRGRQRCNRTRLHIVHASSRSPSRLRRGARVVARPRRLRARGRSPRWPPTFLPSSGSSPTPATLIGLVLAARVFCLHAALRRADGRRRTCRSAGDGRSWFALLPMAVCLAAPLHAHIPGDRARALRLLLRVLHRRPTAAFTRTSCRTLWPGPRASSTSCAGPHPGAALVGGGFLLSVWEPFPFPPRRGRHAGLMRRGGRARPRARRQADTLRALSLDPGGALARRPPREAGAASSCAAA